MAGSEAGSRSISEAGSISEADARSRAAEAPLNKFSRELARSSWVHWRLHIMRITMRWAGAVGGSRG